MAIEFKIDAEAEVIYSVFTGEFRSVDIQDHRNRFTADPLYHPNFSHLIDARSANLRLSGEEARILAAWAKLNRSNAKTVFVIDEESQGLPVCTLDGLLKTGLCFMTWIPQENGWVCHRHEKEIDGE